MAHAVAEEPQVHMGLPLPHGKVAMWLFLVTEIMFFTALIGTYIILRNGMPSAREPWPTPHDVHLEEWIGALNTFILICSSLTIVLAHLSLHHGQVKRAVQYVAATLLLGTAFIAIKFIIEYPAKFSHGIWPSTIFEKLDGPSGPEYLRHVEKQLTHITEGHSGASSAAVQECKKLLDELPGLTPFQVNERIVGSNKVKGCDQIGNLIGKYDKSFQLVPNTGIEGILEKAEKSHPHEDLHLSYSIPYGNMWASCYFAMTGLHALHVIGGLVIFVIILIKAGMGSFGVQHLAMVEYTGLYWHFVDIVWIFLFPLLYLV
jgi:cytochrome c oxidase subunit 3